MSSQKLTKKQKKAIAFRERKGKGKLQKSLDDGNDDIPVQEDEELASIQNADVEREMEHPECQTNDPEANGGGFKVVHQSRKRKRDAEAKGEEGQEGEERQEQREKKPKKKQRADVSADESKGQAESDDPKKNVKTDKQRYILFVGNLKYTTTLDAIREHFSACDPPPVIRLLTPKPKRDAQSTAAKSKGCAFLEFPTRSGLQQALKLHHSTLDGRKINVELTAGGGGKSEQRLNKLKQRNKELEAQRKKRSEPKQGEPLNKDEASAQTAQPARFSSTSGVGAAPAKKRTWTVDDSLEIPKRKRGKKQAGVGKQPKFMATGVNAIPVG